MRGWHISALGRSSSASRWRAGSCGTSRSSSIKRSSCDALHAGHICAADSGRELSCSISSNGSRPRFLRQTAADLPALRPSFTIRHTAAARNKDAAMPKKSKKSKSKRLTLKAKYKVIKKVLRREWGRIPVAGPKERTARRLTHILLALQVKEHHKKVAKEARKVKKAGGKKKAPAQKDPGIPKQWPFKAELIQELDAQRRHHEAVQKAKKEERKRARVCTSGAPQQLLTEVSGCSALPSVHSTAVLRCCEAACSKVVGCGMCACRRLLRSGCMRGRMRRWRRA